MRIPNKKRALAIALLLPVAAACALDHPPVKEGLWSIHRVTTTNPGNKKTDTTFTLCRNHAYDQHVEGLAKNVPGCPPPKETLADGKFTTEMACKVGATTIVSKGSGWVHGDTSSHSETHATYTPEFAGMSDMTMVQDETYIGSCPADMQPGDQKSADGHILHLWRH